MKDTELLCEVPCVHEDTVALVKEHVLETKQYEDLSVLFKMFADPTRLKLLSALFQSECCVCDLCELLQMTQSAVSHQLSVLKANRLVRTRRSGKNIFYALDDEHIQHIFNAGLEHILEG